MTGQVLRLVCPAELGGRLDHCLTAMLTEYSRARLQALIAEGQVWVNDVPARKSGQKVVEGDRLLVHIPEAVESSLTAEPIPLDVVFQNKDVAVVNKQAGMVVHPAIGHAGGTLVNAALAAFPDLEGLRGELRPGIVHRLDKDTSGLLLIAKNERSQRWLQEQFRLRKVQKNYTALVDGKPPTAQGRIEVAIGRDPAHRQRMAAVRNDKGREAVTFYETAESFTRHTLLNVHPITGRTHQIRVHLAFLGCPVAGDRLYGLRRASLPIERQFLHAARLELLLPGEKEARVFEAPLPKELQNILDQLRHA